MRFVRFHAQRKADKYTVEDRGYETPCWIWQRARSKAGYGQTSHNGKLVYTHRLYYERHKGPIPEGKQIDHLCRNPPCCNPDHLEPVTQQENKRRAVRKPGHKLSTEQAGEIAAIYKSTRRTQQSLADQFGVSISTINLVLSGRYFSQGYPPCRR
jgi:DNA-binding XRE family transcriptional regulator